MGSAVGVAATILMAFSCAMFAESAASKPHLIFLLADDQGWSNIGMNRPDLIGDEVRSIVRNEGINLLNHRVFKFCSPTRCSFLSGRWPIHVNLENSATRQRFAGVPLNMTTISEKLAEVGYQCHHFGKWHAGQATMAHVPVGRGFKSSLSFFNFGEDHYTQIRGGQALYAPDPVASKSIDPPNCQGVDLWATDKPAYGCNGTYGGYQFTGGAVSTIEAHDPRQPLFLFVAFQNLHPPLQVPDSYSKMYPSGKQTTINGMASFLDESVGNVTKALKARGLWNTALVVYSADNGGYLGNGGNSTPFRGGKFSDFEGGTRVPAWVAGGFVPTKMRGTSLSALIHIADWYATFCSLAGCESTDHRASVAGLPPIDSKDLSELIIGKTAISPHNEMVLSALAPSSSRELRYFGSGEAMISGDWKLVTGVQRPGPFGSQKSMPRCGSISIPLSGVWGPDQPGIPCDCGAGCLFNVSADPLESHDIGTEHPTVLKRLQSRLASYRAGVYAPYRGDIEIAACQQVVKNGGFWGPWLPSPSPWPPETLKPAASIPTNGSHFHT